MSDVPTLTPSELGRLAGPLLEILLTDVWQLIGYILNWGLFGVLAMQVYVYYLAFPKDRVMYKALVYGAFLLEATQTFLFTSSAFRTFATGFGNPAVLDQVDILWFSIPIMSGLVAFIAQAFYAYRITVLAETKYSYLAGLIMLLGGSIANGVDTKKAALFSHFLKRDSYITAGIWEGGSAACNVVIAIGMTYYLSKQDTSIHKTNVLLTKIIQMTIETGTLSAILAIVTLVLTFLPGRPTYYQASISVLGKIYANSMMVAFNSRMVIGSSNATSTAHEVHAPISLLQTMRTQEMTVDIDIRRSMNNGALISHEVSLIPSRTSRELPQVRSCGFGSVLIYI
ncbi:hypothetical protein CVT25_014044 [Psilocybe cyanescens]|uniref:DUF6534 domain-containing protein n=1 Tax=Psilocybe cyanescens TaxID=93625 RepID=A0A409XRL4_PSICY|nr:hypothetical protein CVT25_014044 [Psilocybe cyanescens]